MVMDTVKMSQRQNPSSLPSIFGESTVKSSFHDSQRGNGNQPHLRLSAHSTTGQHNGVIVSSARIPKAVEAFFPSDDDIDAIDLGRIRIEKRSHKQLLPPSVGFHIDSTVRRDILASADLCVLL